MPVLDPIADMLTRIRNGQQALHSRVSIPHSKIKAAVAEILKQEGFIEDYQTDGKSLQVRLKYLKGQPAINGLTKVSKGSRRKYVKLGEIPDVNNGLGVCILSTSHGILEGKQAKSESVGGELICEIW
ncbi:MAG: 30S ribosomal protein S8 [Desulfonatronovibrionaceae bacterium]